jgi:hypothetical protein
LELLRRLEEFANIRSLLPFEVNLWKTQNIFYEMWRSIWPGYRSKADAGEEAACRWIEHFTSLGRQLGFLMEEFPA